MPLGLMNRLDPLRRIRCPFCFERFAACEMHLQCDYFPCSSNWSRQIPDPILTRTLNGPLDGASASTIRSGWWVDPRDDKRRGLRRYMDWMVLPGSVVCAKCERPTEKRLCPRCHNHLPDSAITLDPGHIAIFGPQSVGKSSFITVLIHEIDQRVGRDRGFILDPLTDEIRERYKREYHEVSYGGNQFGGGEEADENVLPHAHSNTKGVRENRSILQPLIYRLSHSRRRGVKRGPSTLLSFFDTAGEDWEMEFDLLRSEAVYIGQARGLLFLIDPLRIREVKQDRRIKLTHKEKETPLADYLDDARKLITFFKKVPSRVPLAICMNKLDRWGSLLPEGTALNEWATGVHNKEEADARLDQTIHEEVQSALTRWNAAGFLENVAVNFPNHRFFACSALGDAAREDGPQPQPTPLLVERPMLWLLEQQGVLEPGP